MDEKDNPFFRFFGSFHHWRWLFRKFETGIFRSSDWGYCQFVFRYHWKGRKRNRPIGIVFSRDASTPIRDISNLGVVCDAISMSWTDFSRIFNLFSVGKTFPCIKSKFNPESRFLCRFDLWFFEVYHKAEFLNLMDEFFCVELTLVSGICS